VRYSIFIPGSEAFASIFSANGAGMAAQIDSATATVMATHVYIGTNFCLACIFSMAEGKVEIANSEWASCSGKTQYCQFTVDSSQFFED